MPTLRVKYKENEWSVELKDSNIIGRSSKCDVSIKDVGLSRKHCEIKKIGDKWVIKDNDSKNGTTVNDEAIGEHNLSNGDVIDIGNVTMRFIAEDGSAPQVAPNGADAPRQEDALKVASGSEVVSTGKGATALAELFAKDFVSQQPSESAVRELDASLPQLKEAQKIEVLPFIEKSVSATPIVTPQKEIFRYAGIEASPPSERRTVRVAPKRKLVVCNVILLLLFVASGAVYFVPATKSAVGPLPFHNLSYPLVLILLIGGAVLSIALLLISPIFHVRPIFYKMSIMFAVGNSVMMYLVYRNIKNEVEAISVGGVSVEMGLSVYLAIAVSVLICVFSIVAVSKLKSESRLSNVKR